MKEKRTCPKCKGTKKEIYHSNLDKKGLPGYWPDYKYRECSKCNGTGEIEFEEYKNDS